MTKHRINVLRVAATVFGGIGLGGMVAAYFVSTWYLQNAPLEADLSSGEVYPYFTRGVTIYLTRSAWIVNEYLFGSMFLFIALSLICFNRVGRDRSLLEKLGIEKPKED